MEKKVQNIVNVIRDPDTNKQSDLRYKRLKQRTSMNPKILDSDLIVPIPVFLACH